MAGVGRLSFTPLISAARLRDQLGTSDCCIIDVRHQLLDTGYGESAYRAAHLPGAFFLHCDRDLSGPMDGRNGRHPLPDPVVLAEKLGGIGISPQTQVVVYDDAQGMIAARLWWVLRWLGHDAVAVLDGGWQAWLAQGGELDQALPLASPTHFPVSLRDFAVDVRFVEKTLQPAAPDLGFCLVDARAADRFRGENETIDPVGGHIPGAINAFFRDNLAADGCFKSAGALREMWLQILNGRPAEQVVHYCGSGVSACHNLLAMEIAGLPGARLYGGSWSEWCADPGRALAR